MTKLAELTHPKASQDATARPSTRPTAPGSGWRVSCLDVLGRERSLSVLVKEDRVLVVGPPGETAVLSAGQLGQLCAALRLAAQQAER
ncbi:MAG: hypothetical protein J2O49_01435 [Sciscionella sp.]|nr:hypothetical protein [Sciscionella sp.]